MKPLTLVSAALISILLSGCNNEPSTVMPKNTELADHVLLNGKVYTVDGQRTVAEAVAVNEDRIIYVGSNAEAQAYAGENTQVHDLNGRLVLPGLHDVHIHPLGIVEPDFCEFANEEMSLDRISAFVRDCIEKYKVPEGEWVSIPLWNFSSGNQPSIENPTLRAALDAASTKHPIMIRGSDGHHAAANSLALANAQNKNGEKVGITKQTLQSDFVDYQVLVAVDAKGEPSGGLTESAMTLIGAPGFLDMGDRLPATVKKVPPILASLGITSIQDAATSAQVLPYFKELEDQNSLTFRYHGALIEGFETSHEDKPGVDSIKGMVERFKQTRKTYASTKYIRTNGAKVFVDGVIEGNPLSMPPTLPNAAVLNDYQQPKFAMNEKTQTPIITGYVDTDSAECNHVRAHIADYQNDATVTGFIAKYQYHPMQCSKSRGVLEHDKDFIFKFIEALDKNDFAVHAHAIGDRAVRTAVDAFASARKVNGNPSIPHNIAHAQLIHPDDQKRIGDMGLYVTFSHVWSVAGFFYDMSVIPFIDQLTEGESSIYNMDNYYMNNVYPAKSILNYGGTVTAGSDAPVDSRDPRPFLNMEHAVTRIEERGGNNQAYNANERLSIHEIIAAYTINGAKALRQQALTGSIEVGKKADLIVLDQDIVALTENGQANKISDTQVDITIFDGRVVFKR